MYRVIVNFTDLKDGRRGYTAGDIYPREGYMPSDKRIEELLGGRNKLGKPVIEQTIEEAHAESQAEEPAEELPKRRKRKLKDN